MIILTQMLNIIHLFHPTGVTSYQDVTDSLKLVIKALRFGQIKPWVCIGIHWNLILHYTIMFIFLLK